jgi:hypothetical protein
MHERFYDEMIARERVGPIRSGPSDSRGSGRQLELERAAARSLSG